MQTAKRTTRLSPPAVGRLIEWLGTVDTVSEVTVDGHTIYNPTAIVFEGGGFVTTEYEAHQ